MNVQGGKELLAAILADNLPYPFLGSPDGSTCVAIGLEIVSWNRWRKQANIPDYPILTDIV